MVKIKPVKKFLIFPLIALGFFLLGIIADRNLNPASPVNIPEGKLIILDPSKTIKVKVERVSDGDTIALEGGERVRYLGVNAPELDSKWLGVEEVVKVQAFEFNKKMVEGKTIKLEFEPKGKTRDSFGRLLAYVWVEGKMVNLELVRNGLAEVEEIYTRRAFKYEDDLLTAQEQAQKEKLGLWEE